jgi:hypothetical protein
MDAAAEFIRSVLAHWVGLLTGSLLAVALLIIEKVTSWHPRRWFYSIVLVGALLFSAFQAWLDEHSRAERYRVDGERREEQLRGEIRSRDSENVRLSKELELRPPIRKNSDAGPLACPIPGTTAFDDERLLVSESATSLSKAKLRPKQGAVALWASLYVEDGEIRFRATGQDPTNEYGEVESGRFCIRGIDNLEQFRAIRKGDRNIRVLVTYYR